MATRYGQPPGGPITRPYAEQYPPGATGWQGDPNAPVRTPSPLPPTRIPTSGERGGAPPSGQEIPTDTTALLQAMLAELKSLLAEARKTVQRGLVYSLTMTVQSPEPVPVIFAPPLFSVSFTCDGAGIVQYRLPNGGGSNWIDLRPNEQIVFSFVEPVIASVGFRVMAAPAVIRVVGVY